MEKAPWLYRAVCLSPHKHLLQPDTVRHCCYDISPQVSEWILELTFEHAKSWNQILRTEPGGPLEIHGTGGMAPPQSSASLRAPADRGDGKPGLVTQKKAPYFHNFRKHPGVILSVQGQIPIWTTCQMLWKRKKYQGDNVNKLVLPADQAVFWERVLTVMKYHNLFGTADDSQKSTGKALNPLGT